MNDNFRVVAHTQGWEIHGAKKNPVARMYTYQNKVNAVIENGTFLDIVLTTPLEGSFNRITYSGGGFIITDSLHEISPGFYQIHRTYTAQRACSVVLVFEIEALFRPSFYMIPGVSYNGNRWGAGLEPKGLAYEGKPWVFSYNRTALPSATFSEDAAISLGVFTDDGHPDSLISSCAMLESETGFVHRILWPEREEPMTYVGRDEYQAATQPEIAFSAGCEFNVSFYVSVCQVMTKNFGWTKTFDRALSRFKRNLPDVMSNENFFALRTDYIKKDLYVKRGDYSLFEIGYIPSPSGDGFVPRPNTRYEIGWCGQNASQALALIHDYIRHKNKDSLSAALAVLDTWVSYATLESGLFRVYFDDIINKTERYAIDTCNLGWGIWMLLEAYESLKTVGIEKLAYYQCAIRASEFFVSNKAENGSFGKSWTADGLPQDTGGTIGCFVLLGLYKAYEITKDVRYLQTVKEMFRFYVVRDLNEMECSAGALDTQCVDKETCWPLLKTALDLYELTHEKQYLEDAIKAGYYLLSFMFHFDAIYEPDSDFELHGYRTYGATTVSAQHHHLDPWGSLLAYDYLRLYKHTSDENWKIRAIALWKNAMLCVSDGELIIHGLKRPASTQNEAFANCRFGFNKSKEPGGMNDWLVAWPGAFKLLTMVRAEKDGINVEGSCMFV